MNMMPPMSGPPGAPGGSMRMQFDPVKDTTEIVCVCGSRFFQEAYLLRHLSKIITGKPNDSLVNIPLFVCAKCGLPYEEMLPPELKSTKISV